MKKYIFIITLLISTCGLLKAQNTDTKLILLGTGTPFADPTKSGPSLAIVVNNTSYIVDCGPGVVRRAAEASKLGFPSLEAAQLKTLFITHLHSDHTIGLADIILTPAVLDRNAPIRIYGPVGSKKMTDDLMSAYKEDIAIRINGLEKGDAIAYQVYTNEIKEGQIYKDSNLTVTAFNVQHGQWDNAFGFVFQTKDKKIVISGDCTYSENLIKYAKDCDILVHEVYSDAGLKKRTQRWQDYHSTFHTSTYQLADIANQVKPKLLILNHQLTFGTSLQSLLDELKSKYAGPVVNGADLDVF
ncbi:MAG: MBL fold metallo-hydrolase [Sediminibacterium sp.]|jgi:ribonuclease BN (tRNA processing enzyme)